MIGFIGYALASLLVGGLLANSEVDFSVAEVFLFALVWPLTLIVAIGFYFSDK